MLLEVAVSLSTLWCQRFFLSLFIYFERERERERERASEHRQESGRERGRERESQEGSALSVQSSTQGLNSQTMRS